jgi:hypothetical protein
VVVLLVSTDLILSTFAIPMALSNSGVIDFGIFTNIVYDVCRLFFDISFCISLAISLIAYYIVNMRGSMFMISPFLLAALILLPSIAHLVFEQSIDQAHLLNVNSLFLKNLMNSTLQTFVFTIWGVSFLLTYSELLSNRRARTAKSFDVGLNGDQGRYYASSLMMRLIIALIGVNLMLWLPVIIIDWLSLNVDIRIEHRSLLNVAFLFSIASKGIFHAGAIMYVLGRRSKGEKKISAIEMKNFGSADTKPLYYYKLGNVNFPKKAKVKDIRRVGMICPSPDSSATTVLDKLV